MIEKNNCPIDDLMEHQAEGKRTLGLLQGKWDAPDAALIGADAEVEAMFYGCSVYGQFQ